MQNFLSEIFHFLVVKFLLYLNRHFFVMILFLRNLALNSEVAPNYKNMLAPHKGPLPHHNETHIITKSITVKQVKTWLPVGLHI